jgi:CBS domain-containing protein
MPISSPSRANSGARGADGATLRLRDIMTTDPAFVSADDSIQHAAQLMDELNVGALPVCDGRRLIGMVTDRDITVRCTAAGKAPTEATVEAAMSTNVQWCNADDSVETARDMMTERQLRRLPVIDENRDLVGMVAMGDIATKSGDVPGAGDLLAEVSNPAEPDRGQRPSGH